MCVFFFFLACTLPVLATAVPQVLTLIHTGKNYITHHPRPFSPVPPHISMHTHVILFCTKGDHRKWCSYIEGDLFWQHSTIEGKPLFHMKQKENTALFHYDDMKQTTCSDTIVLCIYDDANWKWLSVKTENEDASQKQKAIKALTLTAKEGQN